MPCVSTTSSGNSVSTSSLNACSSITSAGLPLQHPPNHHDFRDLREVLAGQLPPQSNPYFPTQFNPLHFQQQPQRLEHFQQTPSFTQGAPTFHPQQHHQQQQQSQLASNPNHRLLRPRDQSERLESVPTNQFTPDLADGRRREDLFGVSHTRRHDPIRLSSEAMDILTPSQMNGQTTPQVCYVFVTWLIRAIHTKNDHLRLDPGSLWKSVHACLDRSQFALRKCSRSFRSISVRFEKVFTLV